MYYNRPLRSIPTLPGQIDGTPVAEWSPWRTVPIMSHIDPSCSTCADPGPSLIAAGYITQTRKGRKVKLRRWDAHRCPACDEMRIYGNRPDGMGRSERVEVLYAPPRTHIPEFTTRPPGEE